MGTNRLGNRGGDLLIHIESEQRCLAGMQITGKTAAATFSQDNVVGMLLTSGGVPIYDGDEASVAAIVVQGKAIVDLEADASTAVVPPYTVINDFTGAVLNREAMIATDPAGGTIDMDAVQTALETAGAKVVLEPTKTETQTN